MTAFKIIVAYGLLIAAACFVLWALLNVNKRKDDGHE